MPAAKPASSLCHKLLRDLVLHNIRSNVISPGFISSEMAQKGLASESVKNMVKNVLLERIGFPSDVGSAVVFLASNQSLYITAQTINVNGGLYFLKSTILIVGGGIETIPGVLIAKKLNLFVVVSDSNPNAPCFKYSDDQIIVSTYDVPATVKAAKSILKNIRPINAVICIASDVPYTVACVASSLGLPGIPISSALLSSDKFAMNRIS